MGFDYLSCLFSFIYQLLVSIFQGFVLVLQEMDTVYDVFGGLIREVGIVLGCMAAGTMRR